MPNTANTPAVITKNIGVPLSKSMEKTSNNTLIVRGFFTSDAPDMHGDIITRSATESATEVYRQWGNIRRMHAPDPVGKMRGMGIEDGLAWNEVEIEVIDPKAIFEVENGLLQALSIGALIKFEDITWLEDGGMLISAYLLGEISLVDHPANYDSFLQDQNSANAAVQLLVRQYGLDNVSRGMLDILKENPDMSEELEKEVVEEDATETTDETVVEIVEEEDVETTEESTEEVEEDDIEVDDIAVENEIVEDEDETEEVELSIDDEPVEDEVDRFERIENQLTELTDLVKSLVPVTAVETDEEIIEEEPDVVVEDDIVEDTDEQVEVEQKTVIPSDALETEEEDGDVEKTASSALHKALTARFSA